jgi:5'-nucleotidase
MMRRAAFALAAVLAAASFHFSGTASGSAANPRPPASVEGLRILLVNDDGVQAQSPLGLDGKGLYELRKALCAAGADVLTVGPWSVQSGMGGRITTGGPVTVQAVTVPTAYQGDCGGAASGGKVFGVCAAVAPCTATSPSASPSDAVLLAVQRFVPDNYWSDGPDVVLSGINFGANVGLGVFHSGTTSAAVTAHELGEAAVAFSEQLSIACFGNPTSCPQYTDHAAFAVRLVGGLRAGSQLKPSLLLNANYPDIAAGETVGGPVINQLGVGTDLNFGFGGTVPADGGTYNIGLAPNRPETRANADTTALTENKISIVPLSGDWTARATTKLTTIVSGLG